MREGHQFADTDKVVFPLDEGRAETMWAQNVGDNLFKLDNMPCFVYDISLGDIFSVKSVEGDDRPYFDKVVTRSGNRTYRITVLEILNAEQRRQVNDLLRTLKPLSQFERFSEDYLALTAPPGAPIERIEEILGSGEASDLWDWELSSPEAEKSN